MNVLIKAVQEIKFTIPPEVLQIGFVENYNRPNVVTSLDDRILNSVLRSRVLVDLNMVGGIPARIPIQNTNIRQVLGNYSSNIYGGEWIIEVPKHLTRGRSIISVINLINGINIANNAYGGIVGSTVSNSVLLNQGAKMFHSLAGEVPIQTSRLELIGENTVLVLDPIFQLFYGILQVYLEYDQNLNNLHPRYSHPICQLCILAVKSYIYNNYIVKLDKGYIYGGHELSRITDIIDSYSEAESEYQENLHTVTKKVLHMNDSYNSSRYIAQMVGTGF